MRLSGSVFSNDTHNFKALSCVVLYFQVVLTLITAYVISLIFTYTNVFPNDPNHHLYKARTDIRANVIEEAQWFRFPYPGQWGLPTVTVAGALGMLAGVIASMIESIGDYYACARYHLSIP